MKTVLIVDDSSMIRRLLRNIVTKHGYKVIGEADNGRMGYEIYKMYAPDIVTLDLVMDEMTGLEALQKIIEVNPEAKVIMVSSMGQDVMIRDAIVSGAKKFLLKPFNEKEVMDAVNDL